MKPEPGARIANYEVVSLLGKGGMGEVWLGRDTQLDRQVAIKSLPPLLATDEERRLRFEREARILASLNHTNIAAIHGLEEVDGQRHLVLEFVPGMTLDARLADGPLGVEASLHVCRQIAAALECAHRGGVVHRDLKPGNVMIQPDDTVKVLDFGLARTEHDDSGGTGNAPDSPTITGNFTAPGVVLGTAPYMSPEQARGRAIDKRSDIWSFGVILYECLTGTKLFAGETASDSMGAILHKQPSWEALPEGTPPNVQLLLRRCLTRERTRRLQDIGDARVELEDAIADPSGTSLGLAAATLAMTRTGSARLPWGVAAALLVALLVLGGSMIFRAAAAGSDRPPVRLSMVLPEGQTFPPVRRDMHTPFDVSPDGRAIVYVASDGPRSERQLYLRRMDEAAGRPLPGTERAESPRFSPDGRWIAFEARDGQRNTLKRIGLDGKPAFQIPIPIPIPKRADFEGGPESAVRTPGRESSFKWIPGWIDGNRLLVRPTATTRVEGGLTVDMHLGKLTLLDAGDGRVASAPHLDKGVAEMMAAGPSALTRVDTVPDRPGLLLLSKRIRGDRQHDRRAGDAVWTLSLEDGTARLLMEDADNARVTTSGRLLFLREGILMGARLSDDRRTLIGSLNTMREERIDAFEVTRAGHLVFMVHPEDGHEMLVLGHGMDTPQPLPTEDKGDDSYSIVRTAPDGASLLAVRRGENGHRIWLIDLQTGAASPITPRPEETTAIRSAEWSPDGRQIAYSISSRPNWKTAVPPGGRGKGNATPRPMRLWTTKLFLVPGDGATRPSELCELEGDASVFGWSRDGRWLLLVTQSTTDKSSRIIARSVESEETKVLVADTGWVQHASISADRKWLAFQQANRVYLQELDATLAPTGTRTLLSVKTGAFQPRWARSGARLYYNERESHAALWSVEIGPDGKPTEADPVLAARRANPESCLHQFAFAPDGRIVYAESTKPRKPVDRLEVILDWTAGLERASAAKR